MNNKLDDLINEGRSNSHVDFEEFLVETENSCLKNVQFYFKAIIGDIQEAGWSVKIPRENEAISDQDLKNVFDKVDRNRDRLVNRMVRTFAYIYFNSLL